ncbi:MAG: pyridoxal kinase [Hyphomicrobiaceae bacterium]
MANILSISSQVVRGAVGNSAAAFALQRLGHTVWQIPTVLLSNHPGHGRFVGGPTGTSEIGALWDGLKAHNWHEEIDAVLTGYMPDRAAVEVVARIVHKLKQARPGLTYLCDPAIGDEPKGLYVDKAAATAIRDELLPLADIATPNRFELAWLTGTPPARNAEEAIDAARAIPAGAVLATSIPADAGDDLSNVLTDPNGNAVCRTAQRTDAQKGTGDFFAAVYLGSLLNGQSANTALGTATAAVRHVLDGSKGHDELQLVEAQDHWAHTEPDTVKNIT